jgi:molecular chaperone DnaJ
MPPTKDYYRILGVGDKAEVAEIKRAYRKLAKKYHPDANPNDPAAAERFKEVSEAHGILTDPEKRKQYDLMRKYGAFGGAARREPRPGGGGAPPGGRAGEQGFDFTQGFEGLGGLGDLFSSIFGRRGRGEEAAVIEVSVSVPLKVAALGGQIAINIPVSEACPVCGGSGAAPGAKVTTCPECNGRGQVVFGQGAFSVPRPCPNCRARGKVASEPCPRCSGQGEVAIERKVMVSIPAGVESGHRLRLKGQGQRGGGGVVGDVIVTITVEADRFLRREGDDLVCTVPINLAQAVLGSRIKVRTIEDKKVVLRIPPGTQSGRKFRIRGQGLAKDGKRGDQLVEVQVQIPDSMTPQEMETFRKFAEQSGLKH